MNRDDFAVLSAGYALGALSPDDERIYIAARIAHPEWDDIVDADAATAAALAQTVAEVATPLAARGALLSLIARTPQDGSATPPAPVEPAEPVGPLTSVIEHAARHKDTEAPHPPPPLPAIVPAPDPAQDAATDAAEPDAAPEPEPENPTISFLIPGVHGPEAPVDDDPAEVSEPPVNTDTLQTVARRSWMRGMFALAASLVFLIALGFGAALVGQQISRPPAVVALDRIEDAPDAQAAGAALDEGGEVTAHWSVQLGEAVLVSQGLPSLADDQTYQMWFVRDDAAISAGTFAPVGDETTTQLAGTIESGDVIAVTVEPAGGSEAPTSDPILAIPTAS